ncbi:glyoxylate/hydroxypyruvate reductase A [Albimonas sp. CAU 1670]|uniref:2-hydroxyacid dehydrogenase n=1 Tax=Albimonas sp. CAU 1670 TaxID=3032599 RepID=UPI0023DA2872|nr:glyoxylate/hydroxypyruvate reductase A [Albimonas sp. CAU 1670]MDF2232073.1 glyoxylate/hydroxypyruvate reductase A [Albimonas sp. CAU 1670]
MTAISRPVILFGGRPPQREEWGAALRKGAEARGVEMDLRMAPEDVDPAEVDAVIYNPEGPIQDFTPFTRLKAALNMWAGVEKVVGNQTLKAPLTRMVEPGLTEGMTDWVVAHATRLHAGIDHHLDLKPGQWPQWHPPLARERKVGVLGLGELGADAARTLAALRFDVAGWSRRPKAIEGVTCFDGDEGLRAILARSEILVLLLPLTAATENLLNAETLALMPQGAAILNPGRGPLIDDAALVEALDSGRLSHATLDVFRVEPLPADHPFWAHPKVTITPHIASVTRASTAAVALVEQIGRLAKGEPLLHVVDRAQGY